MIANVCCTSRVCFRHDTLHYYAVSHRTCVFRSGNLGYPIGRARALGRKPFLTAGPRTSRSFVAFLMFRPRTARSNYPVFGDAQKPGVPGIGNVGASALRANFILTWRGLVQCSVSRWLLSVSRYAANRFPRGR